MWLAPAALVIDAPRHCIYLSAERGGQVNALDSVELQPGWKALLGGTVTGLALLPERGLLAATTTSPARVELLSLADGSLRTQWTTAAGACSPIWASQAGELWVCQRFAHSVACYDASSRQRLAELAVLREPVAAALSPDESLLLVANHLPEGRADTNNAAAAVTLIDTRARKVRQHLRLPVGATALRGVAVDPTGSWAVVTHGIARYQAPATQVENGWMNLAAVSLLDLKTETLRATVLLDQPRRGAANPWAVGWSHDDKVLCVTHAGTHELSVIGFPALLGRLAGKPTGGIVGGLALLDGIRQRLDLGLQGPRSLVVQYPKAYTAGFFDDTLAVLDLAKGKVERSLALSPGSEMTPERLGELVFNDATKGHQHWQSCASCHPDGRADGLNWDLLNDGIGNPKNTKSLLLSFQTPPAMSLGVRETAPTAVRSGFRHILFMLPKEEEYRAVDAYLQALRPLPSPHLQEGRLSEAAERGRVLFASKEVGCAACHPGPLFTDLKPHDVGTVSKRQPKEKKFDTPTLVECWRTAPYLHDGSAVTLRDVLTTANPTDQHGHTSHLTPAQLDDLVAYVRSL